MNHLRRLHFRFVAVPSLLAALAFSAHASADVLPPNDCTAAAGTSCTTAGPHFDQPGICTSETCHSGSPGGGSFACVLCELVDAGPDVHDASAPDAAGSDSGIADAATNDAAHTTDGDSGSEAPPPSTSLASSSSSCSASSALTGAHDTGALFVGLGALGLITATFSRRRRKE